MSVFDYHKDADGIVTVTMDMSGPVNAMNAEFDQAMAATVAQLEAETDLAGVVLASAKKTFFAGGDLQVLLAANDQPAAVLFEQFQSNKKLLRRFEQLPVPTVAAINGAALGGGWELCLLCNHRIGWDNPALKLGLPEVTLGLLPGAGGVVRMTHLLGIEQALPYLLEGKPLRASQAQQQGLLDQLVNEQEQLIPAAKAWIIAQQGRAEAALQPWDSQGHKIPGGNLQHPKIAQLAMAAPIMLHQKTRGLLPAPERILDTAIEALKLPFDLALEVETRNFVTLVRSAEAKNMISTFFFGLNQVNGGASRPNSVKQQAITKLGIIGAGMMGQGIAFASAKAGIEVVLKDVSLEAAQRGKAYSGTVMDKRISRGRATDEQKQHLLERITPTALIDDLSGCDLIIEAVFEQVALKHQITEQSQSRLAADGIWGSNTSTLPIRTLAQAATNPDRFIGIHFFSPVDKMPLVELICGEHTSAETLAKAFDYVQQIGKTPIVVNDSVGFFTSRTFGMQLAEASQMVAEGLHPLRVDNLGKAIGMPVGPLTIHDEVSQQLSYTIRNTQVEMGLKPAEDSQFPQGSELIRAMVEKHNRKGRYHGDGGYFDYHNGEKTLWPPLLEHYYQPQLEVSDDDIKDRLLFINVIEALRCLQEGVVTSVADANIGSIMGIGAPTWTGGYVQFVNGYGLQRFIDRCQQLTDRYGERFRTPEIVAQTLKTSGQFS
ncbi:3-hydroxyacyl-CoA dehydrogenase NAD-binding domain-containing protein [Ferrimonas lipolytica]|uniref:3-hydroxyacyl-CoA dehydrogenase n=1 Tax=Ferrimonas lipolytica TaxID=2724191 RepID=A0A6H1UEN2_9GAMM|nr:3-hydroxyacyl-CoA dehydrogenase NAD-binding domain-containing protein [Ferrimonas lipolytica]QIZ77288.1 3-hydroxyacyl-CoA dehydrogenase [Ferrimonas lipolytica]